MQFAPRGPSGAARGVTGLRWVTFELGARNFAPCGRPRAIGAPRRYSIHGKTRRAAPVEAQPWGGAGGGLGARGLSALSDYFTTRSFPQPKLSIFVYALCRIPTPRQGFKLLHHFSRESADLREMHDARRSRWRPPQHPDHRPARKRMRRNRQRREERQTQHCPARKRVPTHPVSHRTHICSARAWPAVRRPRCLRGRARRPLTRSSARASAVRAAAALA